MDRTLKTVALIATLGCVDLSGPEGDGRMLRFSGTVRSSATGQPIPGAAVSLEAGWIIYPGKFTSDTTDQSGQYSFEYEAHCEENSDLGHPPWGIVYGLVSNAIGYQDQSNANIGVTIRCISTVQTVHFTLALDERAPDK